ncbi:MAG: leucine-rich repeat-containing protein kinase family protein [Microgenomates group bacterium]
MSKKPLFDKDIEILDLSGRNLSELPTEVGKLSKLKVLFLSNNPFKEIPKEIIKLQNLRFLGMKSCNISNLSENSLPESLEWLTLTDNKITKLPKSIKKLTNLRKLLLAGNQISVLPDEMLNCQNIELMRISANRFTKSPISLIKNLSKLSWYSDSGNPFSVKNDSDINHFDYSEIKLDSIISQNAKNIIYKVTFNNNKYALKVFSGIVNSDGYIVDEVQICAGLKKHPNIIETNGIVDGAPNNQMAMLMELVPESYKKLSDPPSFETCTRDVYPQGISFTDNIAKKILDGVKKSLSHMHKFNISNGDVYGHNILFDLEGNIKLGDFGAATKYGDDEKGIREEMDLRALRILSDELMAN